MLAISAPVCAGPTIGTLYPSADPGVNRRFELTFAITDIQPHGEVFPSDGNIGFNPFWPETAASGPVQTAPGVKVWAEITAPNGSTFTLSGFWCVEYEYLGDSASGYDRIVPINHPQTGAAEHWHIRFIPAQAGLYSATVYADDPDPTSPPSSASTTFEVQSPLPSDHGIPRVSADGSSLELADGTPFCQFGFMMPQGCPPVAGYPVLNGRKGLEILADAGGNFIRRWLVNTAREDIYRGISWHQGSGQVYDDTVARRGSRSKIVTGSTSTITAVDRSFLGCRPGRAYTGSIWAKASTGSAGRLRMRVNESNGTSTIERTSSWVTLTDLDWQQVSVTFTTASDAKWLHFKPQLEAGATGTFYLDDMDLRDSTPGSAVDWNMIQNPSFERWSPIQLDVANLWRADYCLKKCEELGIKAQLTLFDYRLWNTTSPVGFFYTWYGVSFWGDMIAGNWQENECVAQEKRILRYAAARYGGYPSMGLWELTNEMSPNFADVAYSWQQKISEFIQSVDLGFGGMPNQRPVTNSYWASPADTTSYEHIAHMQVSSVHSYMYSNTNPDLRNRVPGWWIDGSNADSTDYHSYPKAYHVNLDYGTEVKEDTLIAHSVGTRPNKLYKFRYWLRIGAMTGSKPRIRGSYYCHDAFGRNTGTRENLTYPAPGWSMQEMSWTSGPSDADVELLLGSVYTRTVEVWFDDMELLESDDGITWRSLIYNPDLTITDLGDDELLWALCTTERLGNSLSAGPSGFDKAWLFSESGLFDWSVSGNSWVFSAFAGADSQGIHSHNMVWAQVMASGARNSPCYWFSMEYMVAKAVAGIDVYTPTWKGVSEFLKQLPFRSGGARICTDPFFGEVSGVTSSHPAIRVVGQQKENAAYFWVSNSTNTWANRIQRGNPAVPFSATLGIPGFAPGDYTLSNYDAYTGGQISSRVIPIYGDGVLKLTVSDLATDTAFVVTPVNPAKLHPLFMPDGTLIEIAEMVVTSGSTDEPGPYAQMLSRSWGVKLVLPAGVTASRGDRVYARGLMSTEGGERRIEVTPPSGEFTILSHGTAPNPHALTNRSLGGRSPARHVPPVKDGVGLYNVGLLVTCWGRVLSIGGGFFYIDDGSALEYAKENLQIRVETSQIPQDLHTGDYVIVTGISSAAVVNSQLVRTLRPRDSSDVSVYAQ